MKPPETPYLTAQEVATRLGISLPWVRKLTGAKQMPHIRIGSRILYRASEVDKWLSAHELTAEQVNGKGRK